MTPSLTPAVLLNPRVYYTGPPSVIHSDLTRILLICLKGRLHTQPVGHTTLHPVSGLNSMYWNFLCLVLALTLLRGPQGLLWILWGPRVINSPAAIDLCSPVSSNFSGAHLSKCKFNKDTKIIIKTMMGKFWTKIYKILLCIILSTCVL